VLLEGKVVMEGSSSSLTISSIKDAYFGVGANNGLD